MNMGGNMCIEWFRNERGEDNCMVVWHLHGA